RVRQGRPVVTPDLAIAQSPDACEASAKPLWHKCLRRHLASMPSRTRRYPSYDLPPCAWRIHGRTSPLRASTCDRRQAGSPRWVSHAKCPDTARFRADFTFCSVETGLPGWAFRIRTNESVRKLSDWNCVTILPEGGASPCGGELRV